MEKAIYKQLVRCSTATTGRTSQLDATSLKCTHARTHALKPSHLNPTDFPSARLSPASPFVRSLTLALSFEQPSKETELLQ